MVILKKYVPFLTAIFSALCFLSVMYFTEQILKPDYFLKSLIKFFTIAVILVFSFLFLKKTSQHSEKLTDFLYFRKMKPAKHLFLCMIVVFIGCLIIFFCVRNQLDFSAIRKNLMTKEQLTRKNCLFVFTYIAIINSFLEEIFFRGFLCHLFDENHRKMDILFSAFSFSLYHLGIMNTWLNPILLFFCIIGLVLVGVFLQMICDYYQSIKASWLVHGCANLAINTIGIILIYFY